MELQACHRAFAPSRRDQDRERILVLPRLFALHRWPLPPLWGSWNSAEFPVHLSLKLFLLSMCIEAPESTTNSRSLRDFEVGAGVAQASIDELKRSFVRILELVNTFVKSHATLRAHLSCCKVSSCLLSANLGAHGLRS